MIQTTDVVPPGVLRLRTVHSPSHSGDESGPRVSISSADSADDWPKKPSSVGSSPNGGTKRRISLEGDAAKESPIQKELKKMHKVASALAIALTETHESDEDLYDKVTVSEFDDDELTDEDDDDDEEDEVEEHVEEVEIKSIASFRKEMRSNLEQGKVQFDVASEGSMKSRRKSHLGMTVEADMPLTSIGADSWFRLLDALDHKLSGPIFRLNFGKVFEFIMLIFGTWFGLPVPAWGLWTAMFANLDELPYASEDPIRSRNVGGLVALAFLLYSFFFTKWVVQNKYQSVYGNLKQLIAVPLLFTVVFYYGTFVGGRNLGAFFVVTWVVAEVLGHLLKYFLRRYRPVAYVRHSHLGDRHYYDVQAMFAKGHTAFESFPSADTIGGAVFSCTLLVMEFVPPEAAVALSLTIAFSRVYLQAHHLLDVTVGGLLGWGTTFWMWEEFGKDRLLGPSHAVFSVLFFVVFALVARKFKRALPKHMERTKSMHGF